MPVPGYDPSLYQLQPLLLSFLTLVVPPCLSQGSLGFIGMTFRMHSQLIQQWPSVNGKSWNPVAAQPTTLGVSAALQYVLEP